MNLYVELWKPHPKWLGLSEQERRDYIQRVRTGIKHLTDTGAELVGFAINDEDTPYRSDYRYLAVWKMPDREQVDLLEQTLEEAGWHEHFEQVNARGAMVPPPEALADMVALGGGAASR